MKLQSDIILASSVSPSNYLRRSDADRRSSCCVLVGVVSFLSNSSRGGRRFRLGPPPRWCAAPQDKTEWESGERRGACHLPQRHIQRGQVKYRARLAGATQ